MRPPIKRVLIYRLGSLGDTIVALPAYHLIERAFPGAERVLLTNFPVMGKAAPAAAILDGSGLVDGYISYPVGTRSPIKLLRLWWKLLLWRPEALVYLGSLRGAKSAKRDSMFFRLCGIQFRHQIGVPLTEQMQTVPTDPVTGQGQRESDRIAQAVSQLGDARVNEVSSRDLRLTQVERAKAREVLAPAVGHPLFFVSVGTKVPANHWGIENWEALAGRLGSLYPGCALAAIGAGDEREMCERVVGAWRAGTGGGAVTLNLCGLLTPRESSACLAHGAAFLGHDSGPLHLAAAAGTPCVGIYSGRNLPGRWFPFGDTNRIIYHRVSCIGCGLERCTVEQMRCIRSVTVDEVMSELQVLLGSRRGELVTIGKWDGDGRRPRGDEANAS